MLNRIFRRTIAISRSEQESLRLANLTLQGRLERLLEEQTTRRLRYTPFTRSTHIYYH